MTQYVLVEPRGRPHTPYLFEILGASIRGYAGRLDGITPEQRLAKAWQDMIRRCYDVRHSAYRNYGGKGVSVCKEWHRVGTYIQDVQSLHGWLGKLANWSLFDLDKDYYSSNQYSPATCVWLSRADNTALDSQPLYVIDTLGVKTLYLSQVEAGAVLGTVAQNISQHILAKKPVSRGPLRGFRFEPAIDAQYMRRPLIGESNGK